ncbi:sigma-54-dependent transcriptional regulator [Thioalkalivibrio paradoxus]|uniref:Fis family transcriptional regulator n=1 Tax=Thioalkalivibrio paradoxus ARh 1 TaxID=713585 RepID=W0DFX4_9GAMM|nr:sigma-54 dependent transcriptional regulator [Thioalkalivibrio paradoxus]AHE97251.1 Fis family transcriptional regulator [Thioalkalivibrio paradoxus ARh 1]
MNANLKRGRVEPAGSASSAPALGSILVASAEAVLAQRIARALSRRFALVEVAHSIAQAEKLRQRCAFDLLITATQLPDGSGLNWIESLRDQGVDAQVILLDDQADMDSAIAAVRAGASDYLVRPLHLARIESAVDRSFARRRHGNAANEATRPVLQQRPQELVVAHCEMVKSVCAVIKRVASTRATVLVLGESGTGKEVAARSLHAFSQRTGSFVPINCGAISPELLESELFGHAKGAFTGAHQARNGLFTYADGGTLFLDEIAEMPMAMQSKLLRVLDDQKIRPVGGNREVPVDVRVIAATNRDLAEAVRAGDFREDLYYRINVLTIRMPALRERREDVPVLAEHFVRTLADELSMPPVPITEEDIEALNTHDWPGNVRELRNVIERAVLLGISPAACLRELAQETRPEGSGAAVPEAVPGAPITLAAIEKRHIQAVLDGCGGNKSEAARKLEISRKTLDRKLQQWGRTAASPA